MDTVCKEIATLRAELAQMQAKQIVDTNILELWRASFRPRCRR